MPTLKDQAIASLSGALVFLVLSNSWVYDKTNMLGNVLLPTWADGCPTAFGRVLHTLVFVLVVYGIMMIGKLAKDENMTLEIPEMWKISLVSGLLYFFFSSGAMYELTNKLSTSVGGPALADNKACPTTAGLIAHAVVYFAIILGWMQLPDA